MAQGLTEGRIDAFPFTTQSSNKEKAECDYCDYKAVCFMDKYIPKNKPAIKKREEYLKELDREAENDG